MVKTPFLLVLLVHFGRSRTTNITSTSGSSRTWRDATASPSPTGKDPASAPPTPSSSNSTISAPTLDSPIPIGADLDTFHHFQVIPSPRNGEGQGPSSPSSLKPSLAPTPHDLRLLHPRAHEPLVLPAHQLGE